MSTPSTQNLTKSNAGKKGTGGSQETFTGIRYGCNHGSICFGHISQLADVVSDIYFRQLREHIKLVWIKMVLEKDIHPYMRLQIFK